MFANGGNLQVTTVAFNKDGSLVASGSLDSTVRVWDTNYGTELCRLEAHSGPVNPRGGLVVFIQLTLRGVLIFACVCAVHARAVAGERCGV